MGGEAMVQPVGYDKTETGLLLPHVRKGGLLLPKGIKVRKNDPKLDDFLWLLEQPIPTGGCPVCAVDRQHKGIGYLPKYISGWPLSWFRLPCGACGGRGIL